MKRWEEARKEEEFVVNQNLDAFPEEEPFEIEIISVPALDAFEIISTPFEFDQPAIGIKRRDTIREAYILSHDNPIIAAHYKIWRSPEHDVTFEETLLNIVIDLDKDNKRLQDDLIDYKVRNPYVSAHPCDVVNDPSASSEAIK